MIHYQVENNLSVEEFVQVLRASTLGERRPVNDIERMQQMLQHADIIITARDESKIIGVARSVSDFSFCTYLSDLAVDETYQRKGIGKELIRQTQLVAPKAKLILISAPAAIHYYPRIGMTRHEHCYYIDDVKELQ
ncbi:MAG: GNAT family N-acetyltransferase [Agriterribacter sp.]